MAKGEPFIDPEFPPEAQSLYKKDATEEDKYKLMNYWARASELFDDPDVFKDGVNYKDIKQGSLGDCYFLAALSSAAEVPTRVVNRFITKVKNDCGIYAMTFFVNG